MEGRKSKPQESSATDILTDIINQVLAAGANKFEVEYKDGEEHICVMHGFCIASLQSASDEAQELRAQLYRLEEKPGKVQIDGVDYLLRGEIFDSFGEDAFRVEISPNGK
jgi:hypothetical protein